MLVECRIKEYSTIKRIVDAIKNNREEENHEELTKRKGTETEEESKDGEEKQTEKAADEAVRNTTSNKKASHLKHGESPPSNGGADKGPGVRVGQRKSSQWVVS